MPHRKIPKDYLEAIPVMKVKYKDIFELKEFYTALREWLLEYGWVDEEDESDHWETYYAERVTQGNVKEIWIQWRAIKKVPDAPYLMYYLDLDYHVLGLSAADIVKEGQKMSVNKGEVEVSIKAFIEKKYEAEFEKQWLLKNVKKLFTQRVYRATLEQRKKELFQEMYALQNFMKQWFKMKRYLPYEESKSFFPSYAWPSHHKEEK